MKLLKNQKGLSIIEVILAATIFVLFASGAVTVVVESYNANRLGLEFTIATEFASEGIEAVKSIKNQRFSNLINSAGTGITRNASNVWAFSGANNTLIHNSSDNYIRTITVGSVSRDAVPPAGNIVASGGTLDPRSKKITSTVTWNFNSARAENISFTTYLSDWRRPLGEGVLVYGDTTSVAQPFYRIFTDSTNSFNAQAHTGSSFTDAVVGKTFKIKTSPVNQEAIAGYVNNSGVLRIMCFDGFNWTSEFTVTVGGTATNDQRFGIAYETTSGDVLVVYSTNAAPANEMAYRTKLGSTGCGSTNWSAATNIDAQRTTGVVQWIRMEPSPIISSNRIYLAWADANSDLSAMAWDGTGWTIAEPAAALETNLERVTASQDVQSFDIAVESVTGNLMVVWGLSQATGCTAGTTIATTNCIRYARYTGSWSAVAVIPTVADPTTNIDISSNPNTNEMVVASVDDNQADLSIAYWSGSAWTGFANQDTTCQAATAGSKRVSTGWLISGATTRYVVTYNDSGTTNIGWFVGGPTFTSAPTLQTDFAPTPLFANPQTWYDIQVDPINKDRLIFSLSDNASDLFAKRLVMTATPAFTWTNSDGSGALDANLGQVAPGPFGFAYWRY